MKEKNQEDEFNENLKILKDSIHLGPIAKYQIYGNNILYEFNINLN